MQPPIDSDGSARARPELRNVVVFAIGADRYAVELRWVREVVSLGFVTGVPTAPAAVAGVCNLHGAILPVLDVGVLLGGASGPPARQGDGALVLELRTGEDQDGKTTAKLERDGVVCALRVDQIDQVASLHDAGPGAVADGSGRPLTLLDPVQLVRRALELVVQAGTEAADRELA